MESNFLEKDKLLIFKMENDIDECSVKEIRRKADYQIERYMPKKIVFDFENVNFMDSAGIGLIIGRYRFAKLLGTSVEISKISDSVRKIFEMSGILKLIPITKENI